MVVLCVCSRCLGWRVCGCAFQRGGRAPFEFELSLPPPGKKNWSLGREFELSLFLVREFEWSLGTEFGLSLGPGGEFELSVNGV